MSKLTYHGGDTVKGGRRYLLRARSFKELEEFYFSSPAQKDITREDYQELDDAGQKKAKDGMYILGCSFPEETGHRSDDHALGINLTCLDFDPPEKEGDPDYARQIFEDPQAFSELLYPLNHIIHTTASHTPERPRVRVIVENEHFVPDVGEVGEEEYVTELRKYRTKALRTVAKMIGVIPKLWKGYRESNVVSQPMYRPVVFDGETYEAVLASRTTGEPLTELDLDQEEDEEVEEEYGYLGGESSDSLLHMPVPDITVADIIAPLSKIDPDCNYKIWTKVIAALRHQFRDEEQAREAFDAVDDWSSGGDKYVSREDVMAKWQSFTPEAKGKIPVTVRSLFKLAMDAGWDNRLLAAKVAEDAQDWMEECEDGDQLLREGPERIAAMPFQNDVVDERLMIFLQKRIKEVMGHAIGLPTIKKAVRKNRKMKNREEQQDEESKPAWIRTKVYVNDINKFVDMVTGQKLSPEAFNHTYSFELMPKDAGDDQDLGGRPAILPVHYATNVLNIPKADGTVYDPRHADEPFLDKGGLRFLNSFRPCTFPKEDPDLADKAGRFFQKHVDVLCGDEQDGAIARHLIDYFAFTAQHPGVKVPWAPVVQSAQGAGKGLMGDILRLVFGEANCKIISPRMLESPFNDWAFGCVFLIVEEMHIKGKNRAEVANALKEVITNPDMALNQKFQDIRVAMNTANLLGFTNNIDALFLEDADRRYMLIRSPFQTKTEIIRLNATGHFEKLAKLKKCPGALLHFFRQWDISSDFPVHGPAPVTALRGVMIEESRNPLEQEIIDLVEDNEVPLVGKDIIHFATLDANCVNTRNNHPLNHYLRKLGYERYADGQKFRFGEGTRTRLWVHREEYDPEIDGKAEEVIRQRLL